MIKNLLFDFGGVLCDLDFKRCMDALARLGVSVDIMTEKTITSGIFQQINVGTITEKEFLTGLKRMGNMQEVSDKELLDVWNSIIVGVPAHRFKALLKLKERFNLYMLSNVNVMHWEYCMDNVLNYEGDNFIGNFKQVFLSYKMHKEKPDKDIFEQVLQEARILPEETLFIDDRRDNTATAQSMGFHVLQALGDEWLADFEKRGWL